MSRIAIIQLARHGDIVNVLPICRDLHLQGHEVSMYVHPDFASILEPVSYVTPVLWPTLHRDVHGAYDHATKAGFDQVLDLQVDGQFRPPPAQTKSFLTEPWARAGYLDRFHALPLVFDRRDAEGEENATRRHLPKTDRPILAYALHGHSSPFLRFMEFEKWLRGVSGEYHLIDIGKLGLSRVHHLLGFIEAADLLVTADTLHLHLAYAFGTPTIALHRDDHPHPEQNPPKHPLEWYWSEPRSHWIGSLTYAQANSPEGRSDIEWLLSQRKKWDQGSCLRESHKSPPARILHVADWYEPSTESEMRRNSAAAASWSRCGLDHKWENVLFSVKKNAKRDSQNIGDDRQLPYLRDVLDWAVEQAGDSDIICFTNTDSVLCSDSPKVVQRALSKHDCAYSHRIHIDEPPEQVTQTELRHSTVDGGTDLFAFKANWWHRNREQVPDFILGCDAWDCFLRRFMADQGGVKINPPIVLHARHAPFWKRAANIEANPGQKHNRSLYRAWCAEHGLPVQLDKAIP
jgi:hypothetical protein